jgi:hypothetical protein
MNRPHGKTVITIETFERTTIRSRKTAGFVRCEPCAAAAPSETAAHVQKTCEVLYLAGMDEAAALEAQSVEASDRLHPAGPVINDQPS